MKTYILFLALSWHALCAMEGTPSSSTETTEETSSWYTPSQVPSLYAFVGNGYERFREGTSKVKAGVVQALTFGQELVTPHKDKEAFHKSREAAIIGWHLIETDLRKDILEGEIRSFISEQERFFPRLTDLVDTLDTNGFTLLHWLVHRGQITTTTDPLYRYFVRDLGASARIGRKVDGVVDFLSTVEGMLAEKERLRKLSDPTFEKIAQPRTPEPMAQRAEQDLASGKTSPDNDSGKQLTGYSSEEEVSAHADPGEGSSLGASALLKNSEGSSLGSLGRPVSSEVDYSQIPKEKSPSGLPSHVSQPHNAEVPPSDTSAYESGTQEKPSNSSSGGATKERAANSSQGNAFKQVPLEKVHTSIITRTQAVLFFSAITLGVILYKYYGRVQKSHQEDSPVFFAARA